MTFGELFQDVLKQNSKFFYAGLFTALHFYNRIGLFTALHFYNVIICKKNFEVSL
jgi:hypothetical protein